jgi:polysaccharide pyruvyl transferase WcaK-like protein
LIGKLAIRYILNNVDAIFLREDHSLKLLSGLKGKAPVYVAADMAFLFKGSAKFSRDLQRPVIGVSPCFPHSFSQKQQENYVTAHSKLLDYMIEKHDVNVVFLPSVIGQGEAEKRENAGDDLEVCRMILQSMANKDKSEIVCATTADEFESLVEQLDLLITTRMHPSILAAIKYVPFAGIIYEHKQIGLLKKLGVEDTAININEVTFVKLRSRVEYVWNERKRIRHILELKIPVIQKETATSVKRIVSMYLSAA